MDHLNLVDALLSTPCKVETYLTHVGRSGARYFKISLRDEHKKNVPLLFKVNGIRNSWNTSASNRLISPAFRKTSHPFGSVIHALNDKVCRTLRSRPTYIPTRTLTISGFSLTGAVIYQHVVNGECERVCKRNDSNIPARSYVNCEVALHTGIMSNYFTGVLPKIKTLVFMTEEHMISRKRIMKNRLINHLPEEIASLIMEMI